MGDLSWIQGDDIFPDEDILLEKAWRITDCAVKGMLLELSCTPKPGLVDRQNNGANDDMDYDLFTLSSASLCSGFFEFSKMGITTRDDGILLEQLRNEGIKVEQKMFRTTGGINTQKGLIFLMGLVCAAAGNLIRDGRPPLPCNVSERIAFITRDICERELSALNSADPGRPLTKGEKLHLRYGMRGIRGEAEDGLPTVVHGGLPELHASLESGMSMNDSMVHALCRIMSISEDTNVVARSDYITLKKEVQPMAEDILRLGGMRTEKGKKAIQDMDRYLIEKNINPGGSADLLAVTCAMFYLESGEV